MTRAPNLSSRYHLVSFERLDSTNEEACRLAREGAREFTIVCAREQTAGRGRRNRGWVSPPGNLYLSLILRPEKPLTETVQLSFVAAVALGETLDPFIPEGVDISYKWPNDVFLAGRKAAGILLESSSRRDRVKWLVLGLGLNLKSPPQDVSTPATSLKAVGAAGVTAMDMLERFCFCFEKCYTRWQEEGFPSLREAWLSRAQGLGGPIEVELEKERLSGTFLDLDASGALVLGQGGGVTRIITAGDVFFPQAR